MHAHSNRDCKNILSVLVQPNRCNTYIQHREKKLKYNKTYVKVKDVIKLVLLVVRV